ncbi:hypothetical protein GUJ93_ZPchr0006g46310 [Zizania palustris]|uniref:Uncharacterized protein n=1 Tax=Zizania palustris TaxID=103762 RepID=A0A8J5W3S2_ZIZPA|nr:hypothetical protein GUJ93_ZPchr0006g46310 [Zizania palustris]
MSHSPLIASLVWNSDVSAGRLLIRWGTVYYQNTTKAGNDGSKIKSNIEELQCLNIRNGTSDVLIPSYSERWEGVLVISHQKSTSSSGIPLSSAGASCGTGAARLGQWSGVSWATESKAGAAERLGGKGNDPEEFHFGKYRRHNLVAPMIAGVE